MTERGLGVDHTTVWRWVQRYAPELDRRVRRELKRRGTSWRVDETYICVAGAWTSLYRAVDSKGATLDFYLSENRDAAAAKQFLGKLLAAANHPRPCVLNVDGNPSYPQAVVTLKPEERLGQRCRCRTSPYLNNIVEQDHRAIKRRINAKQAFRSFEGARRTISGYEVIHMIRKGQVQWLLKGDVRGQIRFINSTLGLKTVKPAQTHRCTVPPPRSYLPHFRLHPCGRWRHLHFPLPAESGRWVRWGRAVR